MCGPQLSRWALIGETLDPAPHRCHGQPRPRLEEQEAMLRPTVVRNMPDPGAPGLESGTCQNLQKAGLQNGREKGAVSPMQPGPLQVGTARGADAISTPALWLSHDLGSPAQACVLPRAGGKVAAACLPKQGRAGKGPDPRSPDICVGSRCRPWASRHTCVKTNGPQLETGQNRSVSSPRVRQLSSATRGLCLGFVRRAPTCRRLMHSSC